MDLTKYYKKIREVEASIAAEFPVVKSKETADGGKKGILTEVPRYIAAKLVVDGIAEVAEGPDLEQFRADQEEAKRVADQLAAAAAAMQLTVIPKLELDALRAKQPRGARE